MRNPYPRKTIHFNRDFINGKSGLFEWLNQMAANTGNASKVMYDALAAYRTIQTHANGLTWQEWIERAASSMAAADAYNATMKGDEE